MATVPVLLDGLRKARAVSTMPVKPVMVMSRYMTVISVPELNTLKLMNRKTKF